MFGNFYTVVIVDIAQSVYTVIEEEELVNICTNLSGLIARNVAVSLSTQNGGTAERESNYSTCWS